MLKILEKPFCIRLRKARGRAGSWSSSRRYLSWECTLLACDIRFAGGKGKAMIWYKTYIRGLPPLSLCKQPLCSGFTIIPPSGQDTLTGTALMSDRETTPASLSLMWNNSLANVVCPQQLEEDPPPRPPTDPSDKAQKKNGLQFWKGTPSSSLLEMSPAL